MIGYLPTWISRRVARAGRALAVLTIEVDPFVWTESGVEIVKVLTLI